MSGYRDEVKPTSNVGKVIVLLLGLTVLAVLIGARLFGAGGESEIPTSVVETTVPTAIVEEVVPTQEPVVSDQTEPVETLFAPKILGAIISGDQLNLNGSAEISCIELIGFLDGLEVGRTTPTASGTWALSVPAPAVGEYDAVMKCVTGEGEFSAVPIQIQVPENLSEETAPVTEGEVITETVDATPVTTETVDATPLPSISVEQPDYTFANDMTEWIGGALLVRGEAEADSEIELIFDNGVQPITTTATANNEGRYAAYVNLKESGEYAVTIQYAGTQASPTDSVVVPPDINLGSAGNCIGTVPPFGTVDGNVYIINSCEYFSLIANRLGVSYRDLLDVNRNIPNLNNLREGERIQIPPLP